MKRPAMKDGRREWCDYPFKGETLRNGAIMAPLLGIIGAALGWVILNWLFG